MPAVPSLAKCQSEEVADKCSQGAQAVVMIFQAGLCCLAFVLCPGAVEIAQQTCSSLGKLGGPC